METAAFPTVVPLLAISRTLKPSSPRPSSYHHLRRRFPNPAPLGQPLRTKPLTECSFGNLDHQRFRSWSLISFAGNILRCSHPAATPGCLPLACMSSSASSFGADSGGGGDDGVDGGRGGGGGDGGPSGGEAGTKSIAGEPEEVSALGSDVIILDVGGMTCGGCAASVKRILESQTQVSSANVNLATETAVVWAVPEAKVTQNWRQQLGEKLAHHLTTCGFKTNLRGWEGTVEGDSQS